MTNPVDEEKKGWVVKRWVEDLLSTRAIAEEDDINLSNGKVSEIISEARKRQPDIDELRRLNQRLKEDEGYIDTLRAANVLRDQEKQGLDAGPITLIEGAKVVKAFPDDYENAISAGLYILSLEKAQRKPFATIIAEAKATISNANGALVAYNALNKQIEDRKKELAPLEEYRRVDKELEKMGTTVTELNNFVLFHKRLKALGFDDDAALCLANELNKRGLTPVAGASELAEALKKHPTLKSAIADLEFKEKHLTTVVQGLRADAGGLQDVLNAVTPQIGKLTDTIAKLKETVDDLQDTAEDISNVSPSDVKTTVEEVQQQIRKTGDEVSKTVDTELKRIPRLLETSAKVISSSTSSFESEASKFEKRMKQASESILNDMERIGETAFKVGGEVVKLEPIATAYRFIGEGEGEPNEVLPMAIRFLNALRSWEKRNPRYRTYDLDRTIRETMENWKISARE